MTTIHWFRRDLRLSDNPALLAAWDSARRDASAPGTASPAEVVGVFVLDPKLLSACGENRSASLLASLAALDSALNGRLVVRTGDPVIVIPEVARTVGAREVHIAESFEPFGRRRDHRVAAELARVGASLQVTGSAYAVAPGQVRTKAGTPYRVFSPFRTAWLNHGWPPPAPRPTAVSWLALPSSPLPAGPTPLAPGGETAARLRWGNFLDRIATYDRDRNRPDLDATSRISTALKWGEIHPRTILADLTTHPGPGADAFRSELAWREFHADVLFHSPKASTRSIRPVLPPDSWTPPPLADLWFEAWAEGRTGYPMVDAGMRQLKAEGWMHGRTRMVVGSFLVKDLHIPWQRGASHFMTHLLDADRAQNQLNWQWVAGTGLDASPYFRIFNPVTQGLKFDPHGDYVRRWVAELRGIPGRSVHQPWLLSPAPVDYPERIVDHAAERSVALDHYARASRSVS